MLRDPNEVKDMGRRTVNCMLTDGGLGDHIASLVAVDYIVKNYLYIDLLVWVPDYLLEFARNLLPNTVIRNFTLAKKKYDPTKASIHTRWDGRSSPMKMHLLDYAFHVLCDQHVDIQQKNYLRLNLEKIDIPFSLPDKFVVVTTGFTAPNREFLPSHINEVVSHIRAKGYEVVFLGKKSSETGAKHVIKGSFSDEVDYSIGVDLIDKTNLLEAAKVMSMAKCVLGLDNGLLHVAGCTDVPIVGGFTNVDPKFRMPVRNSELGWNYYPVVPPAGLSCRFCQSSLNFMYGHDFKNCFYKDYACLKQLSADLYITELEKIL